MHWVDEEPGLTAVHHNKERTMKRITIITALLLAMAGAVRADEPMRLARMNMAVVSGSVPAAASAGCTERFADSFTRSDSDTIGNGWTEVDGNFLIKSNYLTTNQTNNTMLSGTAYSTNTQYAKFTLGSAGYQVGIIVRSDWPTKFYILACDASGLYWGDESGSVGTSAAMTCGSGDTYSIIVTGSNSTTKISFWKNTTNNTPVSPGSNCTDTSKPCWDSAGDSPDVQLTANRSNNTDKGAGISTDPNGGGSELFGKNYYAGDCSD
jgi:hypothetical protein